MYNFEYAKPHSLHDVAALTNDDSVFLAGGQTIIPTLKQRLASPGSVIDLANVPELRGLHLQEGALGIGAMTRHVDVEQSADVQKAIPALAELAKGIGDPQVRHRGTIGGSVANHDPAADYPAALLALGAVIMTNKRQHAADDFFTGIFSTALEPGELITSIGLPIPDQAAYAKLEQRASRYALVGVFVAKSGSDVRVGVSGAGADGAFRCTELEHALTANFTPDAAKAVKLSAGGMLGDLHGSAEYRAAMIPVMASRAVATALSR
ncbi:MAG: xanthine dehydrogenase family protein subunit M [Pseudomonadota bacterium]